MNTEMINEVEQTAEAVVADQALNVFVEEATESSNIGVKVVGAIVGIALLAGATVGGYKFWQKKKAEKVDNDTVEEIETSTEKEAEDDEE